MQAAPVAPLNPLSMRLLPVRDDCILVELAGFDETLALYEALDKARVSGIRQIIPAARTLLIELDPYELPVPLLHSTLVSLDVGRAKAASSVLVEIPVLYDGEDLPEVAGLLGISAEEAVRLHTESEFLVAFTGFAPGFAYLAGGDPRLAVPRRKSPRTHVPAGSVGLAGSSPACIPRQALGAGN